MRIVIVITYHLEAVMPRSYSLPRPFARATTLVLLFLSALIFQTSHADDIQQLRQLAQLAEYIGVDYGEAIENGAVINAGEYQEMQEFSQLLLDKTADNENKALQQQAQALKQAVERKESLSVIQQYSAELRGTLLAMMPQSTLPNQLLSTTQSAQLYQANCAVCHGVNGAGDGVGAAGLEPSPTNFTDQTRAMNRSILGLFDAISNGIDDTSMPSFAHLNEQQRWSLAFYTGSMAFTSFMDKEKTNNSIALIDIVNHNPNQILKDDSKINASDIYQVRAYPETLFSSAISQSPLTITREYLLKAKQAHQQGDYQTAGNLAVSAYLDGFELAENSLDAQDKELRQQIEHNMMALRQLLKKPQADGELDAVMADTLKQLDDAHYLITEGSLSNSTLFTASFIILLREGLEALLVIIALISILVQTQRRSALKYIHFGWISALIAGGATWVAAQTLIDISGASREIMEGVAALLAAVVLLYVGVWMHSKSSAAQWQAYIQQQVNKHLKTGTLWGLAGLSFIAVYREVFETVLFYQSLLTQAGPEQYSAIGGGFIVAVLVLAAITWVLLRYSVKLPIATFFALTTYVLVALAFILAGKAISALQEAGLVGISSMPTEFSFHWLGINSTWQGVLAQAAVVIIFVIFMVLSSTKKTKA